MCAIRLPFCLILAEFLIIGVYAAPKAPGRVLHLQRARIMHAEPIAIIPRTDKISMLKKPVRNTEVIIDKTKRTAVRIRFCKFCEQPSYRNSQDCQKHCSKKLAVKDKLSKARIMHAEPIAIIPRTDKISMLKKSVRNTEVIIDNSKRTAVRISFCKFCVQPSYRNSQDCQKLCSRELAVKDKLSKDKGRHSKVTANALCAFCKLYPVYRHTYICQQKLCSL